MSNSFYTHTTYPVTNSSGSSAAARAEFDAIMAGFSLLPNALGVGQQGFTGGTYTSATITGATIDSSVIGASAPAAGTFSVLGVTTGGALAGVFTGGSFSGGTWNNGVIGGTTPAAATVTTLNATTIAGNPNFTGSPTGVTPNPGDNSALIPTTAFVTNAIGINSGKNRIINGCCRIAQRASIAASIGVTGYGGPDRFFVNNTGAGGAFTQSQGSITYAGIVRAACTQTVTTGSSSFAGVNAWFGIAQRIEGFNCFDMLGGPAMLSFLFNTNVTGQYAISLRDSTSSQSYVATFNAVANTPMYVWIPIASLPTNLVVPESTGVGLIVLIGALNTATFQSASLGSWQAGNSISASGNVNWAGTIGNFISATEIQLEAGNNNTPFERRSLGYEFGLCQRYFEASGLLWQSPVAGSFGGSIQYRVSKRTAPTVGFSSVSFVAGNSLTNSFGTADYFQVVYTATGAGQVTANWTANSEL